jgi:hypothetical protein
MLAALMLAAALALPAAPAKAKAAPPSTTAPAAPAKAVVAIVPVKGILADEERAAIEQRLRAFLPSLDVDVQPADKTEQAQRSLQGLGICSDAGSISCLVQVGALARARTVLAGVVSAADHGVALELVGVDVKSVRERGRVKVVIPSDDEAGAALAVESAVVGVLKPEAWQGTLRVAVAQRGASIYVDSVPRGFAPLADPIELAPGTHDVFVSLEGFAAWKGTVDVPYKTEAAVEVVLVPGVTEPPPRLAGDDEKAGEKPAEPPPRKTPLRVVMYDVEAVGVDERVSRVINQYLVAEIRKHERVSVLDSSELRALVGDGKSTSVDARACSAAECFAEVADALGADAVIVSQLTNIEGQILFGLRRVDPKKQEVTSSFLERVPAEDSAALLPLVGKAITQTFADSPLRQGQTAGVDERAEHVLNPPPLPPLLAGSLYVGAGVSAAVGAAFLVTAASAWVSYDSRLQTALRQDGDRENDELVGAAKTYDVATTGYIVALGAAGVLGVAALATGSFTDWEGYRDEGGEP